MWGKIIYLYDISEYMIPVEYVFIGVLILTALNFAISGECGSQETCANVSSGIGLIVYFSWLSNDW